MGGRAERRHGGRGGGGGPAAGLAARPGGGGARRPRALRLRGRAGGAGAGGAGPGTGAVGGGAGAGRGGDAPLGLRALPGLHPLRRVHRPRRPRLRRHREPPRQLAGPPARPPGCLPELHARRRGDRLQPAHEQPDAEPAHGDPGDPGDPAAHGHLRPQRLLRGGAGARCLRAPAGEEAQQHSRDPGHRGRGAPVGPADAEPAHPAAPHQHPAAGLPARHRLPAAHGRLHGGRAAHQVPAGAGRLAALHPGLRPRRRPLLPHHQDHRGLPRPPLRHRHAVPRHLLRRGAAPACRGAAPQRGGHFPRLGAAEGLRVPADAGARSAARDGRPPGLAAGAVHVLRPLLQQGGGRLPRAAGPPLPARGRRRFPEGGGRGGGEVSGGDEFLHAHLRPGRPGGRRGGAGAGGAAGDAAAAHGAAGLPAPRLLPQRPPRRLQRPAALLPRRPGPGRHRLPGGGARRGDQNHPGLSPCGRGGFQRTGAGAFCPVLHGFSGRPAALPQPLPPGPLSPGADRAGAGRPPRPTAAFRPPGPRRCRRPEGAAGFPPAATGSGERPAPQGEGGRRRRGRGGGHVWGAGGGEPPRGGSAAGRHGVAGLRLGRFTPRCPSFGSEVAPAPCPRFVCPPAPHPRRLRDPPHPRTGRCAVLPTARCRRPAPWPGASRLP